MLCCEDRNIHLKMKKMQTGNPDIESDEALMSC
jgi:hypothetical protein